MRNNQVILSEQDLHLLVEDAVRIYLVENGIDEDWAYGAGVKNALRGVKTGFTSWGKNFRVMKDATTFKNTAKNVMQGLSKLASLANDTLNNQRLSRELSDVNNVVQSASEEITKQAEDMARQQPNYKFNQVGASLQNAGYHNVGQGGGPQAWNGQQQGGGPQQWYGQQQGGGPQQWYGQQQGGGPQQWYGQQQGGGPQQWYGQQQGGGPQQWYGQQQGDDSLAQNQNKPKGRAGGSKKKNITGKTSTSPTDRRTALNKKISQFTEDLQNPNLTPHQRAYRKRMINKFKEELTPLVRGVN